MTISISQAAVLATPSDHQKVFSRQAFRAEKYELLAGIRSLGYAQGKKQGLEHPLNFHRTCKCRYIPFGGVSVHQHQETGHAFYGGLQKCGSVWTCPVCAGFIEQHRQVEISKFFSHAYRKGGGKKVVMMTFTFPHTIDQPLKDVLDRMSKALSSMRSGRNYRSTIEAAGYGGLIRALEINHGSNGWHPHTHELWIVDHKTDAEALKAAVTKNWIKALVKAGLMTESTAAAERRSVDIKDNMSATQYLTKHGNTNAWGGDKEIAKASTKKGRQKGRSPFQIADAAANGCGRSEKLWWEYAAAVKGKSRLFWSRGLKAKCGIISELTDEELVQQETEKADVLCQVDHSEWRLIRQTARDTTGVLDAAETGGFPAVRAYIDQLKAASPEYQQKQKNLRERRAEGAALALGEKTGSLPPG